MRLRARDGIVVPLWSTLSWLTSPPSWSVAKRPERELARDGWATKEKGWQGILASLSFSHAIRLSTGYGDGASSCRCGTLLPR